MKKLVVLALALWAAWWYAAPRLNGPALMDYARKNSAKPWASDLAYAVGTGYYLRSDYPKAQETFTSFVTDFPAGPHTPRALLHLAEAAEANRDYQTARDTLDRLLKDYPDDPEHEMAAQRRGYLNSR
jgi:TolA-binding protein